MSEFNGFGKDAFPFLKALGFHQNREWFQENKKLYQSQVREPLIELVESASDRLQQAGLPFQGNRKSSLFRINRDIRFTKDKQPYKTHVSGVLSRDGTKKDVGGVYFHIDPEGCFLATGLWHPAPPLLKAVREQISVRGKDFLGVVAELDKSGLSIGSDDMAARMPQGFKDVEDETLAFWIRHKSYVATRPFDEKTIYSDALLDEIERFARDIMPIMNFIWRATDPLREESGNS